MVLVRPSQRIGRQQIPGVQPQLHSQNSQRPDKCGMSLEHADQNAATLERKKQEIVLQNIFAFNKIYCNANIQFDTFVIVVAWASAVSDSNIFYFSLIIWT